MNVEAFENLNRVLRTIQPDQLHMQSWSHCAIGHATRDAWFQRRGLLRSFGSAQRVFGIGNRDAIRLFTARAGDTPDQVIATIDQFVSSGPDEEARRAARRQAIIDQMLQAALKAERAARSAARALVAFFV